jgi:NDP-sugar pyrophosphorylase family protein
MQCLILAGGLGTRMQGVSTTVPKSMLPVNGRPFVDHQLTWLASEGINDVVFAIGHLGKTIAGFVGDGSRWGIKVRYAEDGDTLLGTAGSIRSAIERGLMDEGFFVLYGDSYLNVDFASVWMASGQGKSPLMTVFRNDGLWDQSNVVLKNGKIVLFEKGRKDAREIGMNHIDYGLSVMTRNAIVRETVAGEPCDLADVCHWLSLSGQLGAFEVYERFYEIGSPDGLSELETHLSSKSRPDE